VVFPDEGIPFGIDLCFQGAWMIRRRTFGRGRSVERWRHFGHCEIGTGMSNHIKLSNWRFPRSRYLENPGTIAQFARRALRTPVHGSVQGVGGSWTTRIVTAGPNSYLRRAIPRPFDQVSEQLPARPIQEYASSGDAILRLVLLPCHHVFSDRG